MKQEVYRYEARSIAGFVSQVCRYIASGHYVCLRGLIPKEKDPLAVDRKLLQLYDIARPRWRRERRNRKESAGIHYLRYDRLWVIMLTKGRHDVFYKDHGTERVKRRDGRIVERKKPLLNLKRQSLKVFGYAIKYDQRSRKTNVRLDEETQLKVRSHMLTVCVWDSYRERERMEREFHRLPYQAYGPVYKQLKLIAQSVNRARRKRGFEAIDLACIKNKRWLGKVFLERNETTSRAA